jgi:transposase-like protein
MRRLTAWIGGVASGVVAYRFWRRHTQAATEPAGAPETTEPDERAEELREKLAESRAEEEPSPAEPAEAPEAVEERRQRVHEEGRAALDEMKSDESA